MSSTQKILNLRITPWPLLHGVLLCVMILSICIGLGAYITYFVALPVAIAITVLFSHISNKVTGPRRSIRLSRRLLLAVVLSFLFSITGAFSYATLYELLVAKSSGARYLDAQNTSARSKLQLAAAGVTGFVNTTAQLATYSDTKYETEKNSGGSCPVYYNSGKRIGPIATFRLNDSLTAKEISNLAKSSSKQFTEKLAGVSSDYANEYASATAASKSLNTAIQNFNSLKADASLKVIDEKLTELKNRKVEGDKDCGDTARATLIETAIRSLKQLQDSDSLKEIRPGIDLDDKKAITSISLLRGITLVASIPPLSIASSLLGINTSFNDDPLMKAELKAKGTLNYETLPLAVSALLELMIILTARLAHTTGNVVFPLVNTGSIDALQQAKGAGAALKRAMLNLVLRNDSHDEPADRLTGADSQRPYSHTSVDPTFSQREKEFAHRLLPWVVDLDWGTFLVLPDLRAKEIDHHAAGVLVYERLATVVALHVPWVDLAVIDYALLRKAEEGRYGSNYSGNTFHVYELSEHFAQLLRLELLRGSASNSPQQDKQN